MDHGQHPRRPIWVYLTQPQSRSLFWRQQNYYSCPSLQPPPSLPFLGLHYLPRLVTPHHLPSLAYGSQHNPHPILFHQSPPSLFQGRHHWPINEGWWCHCTCWAWCVTCHYSSFRALGIRGFPCLHPQKPHPSPRLSLCCIKCLLHFPTPLILFLFFSYLFFAFPVSPYLCTTRTFANLLLLASISYHLFIFKKKKKKHLLSYSCIK